MGYITSNFITILLNKFLFQSSFELMGYITQAAIQVGRTTDVSKLFRAYGLYNFQKGGVFISYVKVSKLFRAYGLYNIQ